MSYDRTDYEDQDSTYDYDDAEAEHEGVHQDDSKQMNIVRDLFSAPSDIRNPRLDPKEFEVQPGDKINKLDDPEKIAKAIKDGTPHVLGLIFNEMIKNGDTDGIDKLVKSVNENLAKLKKDGDPEIKLKWSGGGGIQEFPPPGQSSRFTFGTLSLNKGNEKPVVLADYDSRKNSSSYLELFNPYRTK
ncbi:MAG: hypothetical protein K2X27_17505 [Candidatus Obscuribacterales bacterium]|nr:hypothetical protein [Candidatus Obscuribacterales bacterium]